jgi:protein-S-isoprenylcysteine O-methyltransferase Ste14
VRANRFVLVLLFGLVLIYLPIRLFSVVARPAGRGIFQVAGILICAAGGAIALWCASSFVLIGRGTPAPFAAPRRLVTRGPYRFVRNPMYIGVGVWFGGAALFYQSSLMFAYVVLFVIASRLFVVWYEEPTLRSMFGSEYSTYCSRVWRWWPVIPNRCR